MTKEFCLYRITNTHNADWLSCATCFTYITCNLYHEILQRIYRHKFHYFIIDIGREILRSVKHSLNLFRFEILEYYILHYNISSLFPLSVVHFNASGIMHYMIRLKACKIICQIVSCFNTCYRTYPSFM